MNERECTERNKPKDGHPVMTDRKLEVAHLQNETAFIEGDINRLPSWPTLIGRRRVHVLTSEQVARNVDTRT